MRRTRRGATRAASDSTAPSNVPPPSTSAWSTPSRASTVVVSSRSTPPLAPAPTTATLAPAAPHALTLAGSAALGGDDERRRDRRVEQRARRGHAARARRARPAVVHGGAASATPRTVSAGWSVSAVPDPITIACESARSSWASTRASADVIHCDVPSAAATRPSRLDATLATKYGRPVRRWCKYGASNKVAARAPSPTSTAMPAVPQPLDAGAGHAPVGVLDRDDDAPDARGDERVGTRSGAAVMGAGLERDVRSRTARAVTGRVQRFDLGVRAAGRLRRALADDDTVPHEDTTDPGVRRGAPAGGGGERQRPIHGPTCRPGPGVVVWRVVVRRGVGHDPSVQRPGRRQETTTAPTRRSRDGGGDRGPLPSGL